MKISRVLLALLCVFVFLVAMGFVVSTVQNSEAVARLKDAGPLMLPGGTLIHAGGSTLVAEESEFVEGNRILESIEIADSIRIVLAQSERADGVVLARITSGGFETLLADGTDKHSLSVTSDGLVVFAEGTIAPFFLLPDDTLLPGSSDEEEVGAVSASSEAVSSFDRESVITAYSLRNGTIKTLGSGISPRVMGGLHIVALAEEGVVRIDPRTSERVLLLPYQGADALGSAIAPDGRTVVLKSSMDSFLDVFTFTEPSPRRLGIIAPGEGVDGIAFLDSYRFILRFGATSAVLYEIPAEETPAGRIIGSPITIR